MSFAEKISSLMVRPNQDPQAKDDIPWTLKYGGRILGTVGGFFAILFGLFNCLSILTINIDCVISGIIQILAGFVVLVCEAPCCCIFIDQVQHVSDNIDRRPHWNKAALYCGMAIPPILICFGLGSLFGSGLIFGTGIIYGMIAIGKKAPADEMRSNAVNSGFAANIPPATGGYSSRPIQNPPPSMSNSMRSNLVDNAAPIGFTGVPIKNVY